MNRLMQDFQHSLRGLRASRSFTLTAVLTMALGIGANTAMFSVVNGVLIKPLPYPSPNSLVRVWSHNLRSTQAGSDQSLVSPGDFLDWQAQSRTLSQMAGFTTGSDTALTGVGEPERVAISSVSRNFFNLLGVRPASGRDFLAQDEPPDQSSVIISDSLWRRRLNADPNAIGRALTLDGQAAIVIGVMPREFNFPASVDVWRLLRLTPTRGGSFLNVVARIAPAHTLSDVRVEMDRLAGTLEGQFPATNTGWTINVVPMHLQEVGRDRRALLVLSAVVVFVLLIACANLANLLSARAAGRRREMAVRAALGASFAHLVRLLFTESLMLSLLGGVAGVLLASVATPWLLALNPDGLTRAPSAIVDGRVLLFTAAISVVAAFMFGLVPALELRRLDIERPLREAGRSGARSMTRSRSRRWLVVSEVAISFAVLVLAGLSMKSFLRVLAVDPGVRAGNLLTMAVRPPGSAYSVDRIRTFYSDLLDRLERLPGVTSAAATSMLPLGGDNRVYGFRAESSPTIRNEANYRVVTPHYFRTMGMAVVAGRDFDDRDATDFAQVAIVNQAMARRFWSAAPGALGQRIVIRGPAPPTTIVGVVSDVRHFGVELPAEPEMYVPHGQAPMSGMTVVIRTVGDPNALAREAREQVRAIDPNLPVSNMRTMENVMEVSTAPRRFTMLLFDLFGAIALLLAAVGVYGVTRHAVAERTAEIGVRVALGAAPRQILMLIVGQHLRLFLTGTVIGAFGALLVGRLTSAMLFQVQPNDPVVFLAGAFVLVTVSLAASYLPARRALHINPVVTLRSE